MAFDPSHFRKLCCNFLWQIWLHICEEVWWSDSMKCMHMISSDRGHSEGWGSTAVWDLSENYNVIAKDCHQMTGNSLRSAWEIFDQVHREWTWRCQMGIHVGCATARYQNHKSYVCPQITRWCNWKWWNKSIFLAVQDASFYTVGKIARKNLATGSRIFSCYPSGHIDSRKLVCYL